MQYRDDGYLPHALLNYIVRLGWSHGDQEIFSRGQMVELFRIEDVNTSAARFDPDKLNWINQQYLKNDPPEAIAPHLEWQLRALGVDPGTGPATADVVVALRERAQTLKEMAEKALVWYQPLTQYDDKAVAKHLAGAAPALQAVREGLAGLASWSPEAVDGALRATAESLGLAMGKVAQPVRVAITGTAVSPSIEHTVYLAGRDEALLRIDAALARCT
jgi:glutamyl-tRNA synthetase